MPRSQHTLGASDASARLGLPFREKVWYGLPFREKVWYGLLFRKKPFNLPQKNKFQTFSPLVQDAFN